MKKLILSLLIFCSAFASAQISIPQVTGLPAALNSKVDKATGKSLVADTLSAKIQPTATAVATKEPLLPSTPSNPESRFLNGNKQWAEIVLGSGGYASNVYFTNLTSAIVGTYKQTSATHELTETIASGTCNNNEVLIHTYLFEQPVGITTVDAGVWRFTMNSKINSNVGDSKFKIVQFKRSSTGVETDMFTIYSNTIENTDYQNFITETVQPSFLVDSLDRFGCRIYATTTTTVNKTISYKVGDGFASYLNTPLALRHPQLRDPNGNSNVQHLTAAQVAKVNATSGTNTGDETLTSIKTKLGAATPVSDGYLRYQDFADFSDRVSNATHTGDATGSTALTLATVNSNVGTFNNVTINAKGLATAGSNVSYEPAFSKNTAFNKNFGTTTGTVLEGRTFGTAANSAVGDFIKNQNSSAQSANMWISGSISTNGSDRYLRNSLGTLRWVERTNANPESSGNLGSNYEILARADDGSALGSYFSILRASGEATFASTVNSTGFLLNGNNLTSSLSTNYLPKWNGSSFVNATAGTDYQKPITLTTNGTSGAATFSGNVLNVPNYTSTGTGGTYACTPTNVTNLTSSSVGMALYTKTGSVYRVSISGLINPAASGTCVIRLPMPTNISGGVVPMCYSSSNFTTPQGWSVSAGSNYIDLSINTDGADCQFYANIAYVY